jgi:hypothetical protein
MIKHASAADMALVNKMLKDEDFKKSISLIKPTQLKPIYSTSPIVKTKMITNPTVAAPSKPPVKSTFNPAGNTSVAPHTQLVGEDKSNLKKIKGASTLVSTGAIFVILTILF